MEEPTAIDPCEVKLMDPERVLAVQAALPTVDRIDELEEIFDLLGDGNRLRLLTALLEAGELCVCDLAAATTMSESAVSHALRLLRLNRVVKVRRSGRMGHYSLEDDHVRMLLDIALQHIDTSMVEGHQHGLRNVLQRALWIALGLNLSYMLAEIIGGVGFQLTGAPRRCRSHAVGCRRTRDRPLRAAADAPSFVGPSHLRFPASRGARGPRQRRHPARGGRLGGIRGDQSIDGSRAVRDAASLLAVATMGLFINLGSAVILARAQGRSLNMRGALLHMSSDAAGSLAVIVAAVAALVWGATWVDPLASLAISLLVLGVTWKLLRETVHVLMEGAPRHLNLETVEAALSSQQGVLSVHHLHLWNLASDAPTLSAHVILGSGESLHEAQLQGDQLKSMLHERFGIEHVTLDLECHSCETEPAEAI